MPPSMRTQSLQERKRKTRDEEERQRRCVALAVLKSGEKVSKAVRDSGISRGTADRISNALKSNDTEALSKLMDPESNRAGRRAVLSKVEDNLLKQRMTYAANRGFALDKNTVKSLMAQISTDGRVGFQTRSGIPSDDTLRAWRARNRDVTYRVAENKRTASLVAERYEHVCTFKKALQSVEERHSGIFSDPERVWNLDETAVSPEFGRKVKVFSPSGSHHGGSRAQRGTKSNKHVTALVAVSASGRRAPPLFIVSGKRIMESWFEPLDAFQVGDCKQLQWLSVPNWFPQDAVILMSENGSMEQSLMKLVIEHVNRFVRKFVPAEKSYCLTLDGHSSRGGIDWLNYCKDVGCEVVQSPSDTSHFLQSCDKKVNKTFNGAVRDARDALCAESFLDLTCVRTSLMLGIIGFHAVSPQCVFESFSACGLWPMDYRFMHRFQHEHDVKESRALRLQGAERCGPDTRLGSVKKRKSDAESWSLIKQITSSESSPTLGLQQIERELHEHSSVNRILMQVNKLRCTPSEKSGKSGTGKLALYSGTPAMCLTFGDLLKQREARIAASEAEDRRKQEAKALKEKQREEKKAKKREEAEDKLKQRLAKKKAKELNLEEKRARKRAREDAKTLHGVGKPQEPDDGGQKMPRMPWKSSQNY